MSHNPYGDQFQFDRSELFAIGAAAGAVVAAGVSQYLERRRKPQTPLEKAQALGAEALDVLSDRTRTGRKRLKHQAAVAEDYAEDLLDTTRKTWAKTSKDAKKQLARTSKEAKKSLAHTSKEARKRGQKASKEASHFADVAAATLGASAIAGTGKLRELAEHAAERVIGDPYAVSGSLRETLRERADELADAARSGKLTKQARETGESALETIKHAAGTVTESLKDYTEVAREKLEDAHLPDRAREYTAQARDTIKDVKLGERAREYGSLVAEYAEQAREKLEDAHLADRTKEYATLAGTTVAAYTAASRDAAKRGASKLTESASHLADATGEQAVELRRGVQKGVRRTRRRTRWGLRALVAGIVVGLLVAPRSGQATRDSITEFVENILDVIMPDERR
jgi:gas vesicle protein